MTKGLRCLLGHHTWTKFESADGETGGRCSRCGKVDWHHFDPPTKDINIWPPGSPGASGGM
jgi:hypothetical protein